MHLVLKTDGIGAKLLIKTFAYYSGRYLFSVRRLHSGGRGFDIWFLFWATGFTPCFLRMGGGGRLHEFIKGCTRAVDARCTHNEFAQ